MIVVGRFNLLKINKKTAVFIKIWRNKTMSNNTGNKPSDDNQTQSKPNLIPKNINKTTKGIFEKGKINSLKS